MTTDNKPVAPIYFHMLQTREIRQKREDGLPGRLLGRFLPYGAANPLSYRLTPLNKEYVLKWIEEGAAAYGAPEGSYAKITTTQGKVSTK